jgi:hypothetical protein
LEMFKVRSFYLKIDDRQDSLRDKLLQDLFLDLITVMNKPGQVQNLGRKVNFVRLLITIKQRI